MTKKKKLILILTPIVALICIMAIAVGWFVHFWFVPYERHWRSDPTPLETEEFLPRPDSILYINSNGEDRLLTEDELERVYAAFQNAMSRIKSCEYRYSIGGSTSKVDVERQYIHNAQRPCLEFRYEKRRCYVGGVPAKIGNVYEDPIEFDAMMLLVGSGAIRTIPYKGGFYNTEPEYRPYGGEISTHAILKFYANYYEFKQVVSELG